MTVRVMNDMIPGIKVAPDDEHCCGACADMPNEDAYGFGWCEEHKQETYCGDFCDKFKKREE